MVLIRDGRDVVESAIRSWQTCPKVGYLARKMRTFPWFHSAPYAGRYARSVAGRVLGLSEQVRTWGPRYPGIDDAAERLPLLDVCARQWLMCMEAFEATWPEMPRERTHIVRYEDLVDDVDLHTAQLTEFLHSTEPERAIRYARAVVSPAFSGKSANLSRD